MGKPQRDLALSLVVFVGWVLVNWVVWNVAKDLGWLPSWLAWTLYASSFVIAGVGLQLFLRRWRRQFADTSSPTI